MSGERLFLMLTRHSSVPSRVLVSQKWAHTGFTAISDRAGCATKCGRGCFFKKKKMFHRRLRQCVCVCVLANCRCYNDFHPTPLMRWHFGLLLPSCNPTWGQSGGRVVIPACFMSLNLFHSSKDPSFFVTEASRVIPRNPKRKKVARFVSSFIFS